MITLMRPSRWRLWFINEDGKIVSRFADWCDQARAALNPSWNPVWDHVLPEHQANIQIPAPAPDQRACRRCKAMAFAPCITRNGKIAAHLHKGR